ncbi:Alpha/Beta hydrolase protein [Trichoderma sp. SZMC 28015]
MSNVLETTDPQVQSEDGTLIWAASAGCSADQAPVIIFVPGFSSSSLTFRKQFQDENLLTKYCLVTYEPRGQCRSQQPLSESAYSSEKNAQDFKAVCDRYGVKTAVLAGWSYGGLIATDVFSHLGPGWIRGIIYLSGVPWRSMLPEVLHSDGVNALQPLIEGDTEEFNELQRTFSIGRSNWATKSYRETSPHERKTSRSYKVASGS